MNNNFSSKSKFSNRKPFSKDETEDLKKGLTEAIEVLDQVSAMEEAQAALPIVPATIGKKQHFFSVQKADKKYTVVELIIEDGKTISNNVVYSNGSLPMAIAKVGELVSRLTMIKRIY